MNFFKKDAGAVPAAGSPRIRMRSMGFFRRPLLVSSILLVTSFSNFSGCAKSPKEAQPAEQHGTTGQKPPAYQMKTGERLGIGYLSFRLEGVRVKYSPGHQLSLFPEPPETLATIKPASSMCYLGADPAGNAYVDVSEQYYILAMGKAVSITDKKGGRYSITFVSSLSDSAGGFAGAMIGVSPMDSKIANPQVTVW